MRTMLLAIAAGTAMTLALPTHAQAQVELGYTDIGATLGLGNIGRASVAFGGRFEKVFKKLPDLGDGLLGIGVSADIYSYSGGGGSFRYVPVGATANYHFQLDPKTKLDAFIGAGLGFVAASCTLPSIINDRVVSAQIVSAATAAANRCGGASGIYLIGRAGGRYFLNKKTTIYADLGAGAAALNIGVTRRIK